MTFYKFSSYFFNTEFVQTEVSEVNHGTDKLTKSEGYVMKSVSSLQDWKIDNVWNLHFVWYDYVNGDVGLCSDCFKEYQTNLYYSGHKVLSSYSADITAFVTKFD